MSLLSRIWYYSNSLFGVKIFNQTKESNFLLNIILLWLNIIWIMRHWVQGVKKMHIFALCLASKQSLDESVKVKIAMSILNSSSKGGTYHNRQGSSMRHSLQMECDSLREMLILIQAPATDRMGYYSYLYNEIYISYTSFNDRPDMLSNHKNLYASMHACRK